MPHSKLQIAIFGLAVFAHLTFEVSAADANSYIGAVVEYYPVTDGSNGTEISLANAQNFETIIQRAQNYSVDIIVFPENSLTTGLSFSSTNRSEYTEFSTIVPDPGTETPCDNSSTTVIEALQVISCAAKNTSMYVLVNVYEKVNCTGSEDCPSDDYYFYNTNVVFDGTGGIVSRYRKYNLFGEPGLNVTNTPDISAFTTDFNVTFGHIICFDILFDEPISSLINDNNVTDILFPSHWFSELPYLTAVQAQSGFAYANDVNLLASGYNTPATGSGGSGIYAGTSGNLVTIYSETAQNALLVARVPKVINGSRTYVYSTAYPATYTFNNTEITTLPNVSTVAQQSLIRDNLTVYTTSELSLTNGTENIVEEVCDRELCCTFDITRTFTEPSSNSTAEYYKYRMAVFNGVRDHSGVATTGVQICSIIACTNDTLASCGIRFDATDEVVSSTVFNNISISANFSTNSTTWQMPNSLTTSILPLNASEFEYTKTELTNTSLNEILFKSNYAITDLLTFAIYGRNYSGDSLPFTTVNTASSAIAMSSLSIAFTVLLACVAPLLSEIRLH